jgi:hypothetical protein
MTESKVDQSSDSESEDSHKKDDDDEFNSEEDDELAIYRKKKDHTFRDLIDFYEQQRFTIPFMVYRNIKYWNFLDLVARYANIIVTGIYIYIAFFYRVDFFSLLNLLILGSFFSFVTFHVGRRSEIIQKVSGV